MKWNIYSWDMESYYTAVLDETYVYMHSKPTNMVHILKTTWTDTGSMCGNKDEHGKTGLTSGISHGGYHFCFI